MFQFGGHLGLVALLEKIVIEAERGLVLSGQRFELLLDHGFQLDPTLQDLDLLLQLPLLVCFLLDGELDLVKLAPKFLDLRRFERWKFCLRVV